MFLKFNITFIFVVLVLKPPGIQNLQWNHSHEDYGALLKSLINVNEERMKTINKMIRLNDNNFNGLLRTLIQDQPVEDYTIVVVKDIPNHDSREHKSVPLKENLVLSDKTSLRYRDSSDELFFPDDPKTYGENDTITIVRARRRCFFACQNAYRRVCRKFKYDCTSKMRRQFRTECQDACDRRF